MKNPKITKAVICLVGLICYLFPFFKFTFDASIMDGLVGDWGAVSLGLELSISGVQTFATMQYVAEIVKFTEVDLPVIWWVIYIVMAWVAIPFILMAAMGVRNLISQDKNTKVLTIIGGALNAVMIAGVLIYFTVKPGRFSLSGTDLSFTGAWGLWLLLIVNIAMFVLGIYQSTEKETTESLGVSAKLEQGLLVGMNGTYNGSRIPIEEKSELILGRDSTMCNLIVNGTKVSRKHCAIKYDPGMQVYRVIDYSSNGTYEADGSRLMSNKYTSLNKGSIIYLGDQSNMFRLE